MTEKKQAATKGRAGRPSSYTEEVAEELCIRLGLGESLAQICRDPEMPAQSTVYLWLLRHPDFSERYTRAREEQAEAERDALKSRRWYDPRTW